MTKAERPASGKGEWKLFLSFLKNAHLSWGWILLSMAFNIVYYFTVTELPGSTAALFTGKFTTAAILSALTNYGLVMVMMAAVSLLMLIAEAKSVRSLRRVMWTRMMGIQTAYYDEHSAGRLYSAITADAEITVTTLLSLLVTVPGLISYLCKALPMINTFSPKLFWAVIILIPFYILYAILMGKWQYKTGRRIQTRIGGLSGYLTERIRNLTLIKSFVTEKREEESGVAIAGELYDANIRYAHVNAVIVAYTFMAEVIGIVIAVLWGCQLLRTGEIDMTSWLAFYLFVPTINMVLRQLTNVWSNLKDVQGRAARLAEMIEAPQEQMNETASSIIPTGDIVFSGVHFAYREGVETLRGIDLVIPEGKTTAIVGPSGSGKTTILKLLEKLYTPSSGMITVDGHGLDSLNLDAWRQKLSYVNQDAELFGGTVRSALSYGIRRSVTKDDMALACRLSGIDLFISSLPGGYDAELALYGGAMSGGQRQRMVIARELIKNADILLLDEPTSALDAETAAGIQRTFYKQFAGKTIVAVTHELGFIAGADQIIVVRDGGIEAAGDHETLMQTSPTYRALVEEQSYQEVFGS